MNGVCGLQSTRYILSPVLPQIHTLVPRGLFWQGRLGSKWLCLSHITWSSYLYYCLIFSCSFLTSVEKETFNYSLIIPHTFRPQGLCSS